MLSKQSPGYTFSIHFNFPPYQEPGTLLDTREEEEEKKEGRKRKKERKGKKERKKEKDRGKRKKEVKQQRIYDFFNSIL